MYILKLLSTSIKSNLQHDLAYRADLIVNLVLSLIGLGSDLFGLSIIYANTNDIGGWGPSELIILLGVWRLVNVLMNMIIWPNTFNFNMSVHDGSLDYTLLLPVNSQLLISTKRIVIWHLFDFVIAIGLIIIGLAHNTGITSPLQIVAFLGLTLSGTTIIYSLWITLISLTFWFTKFGNSIVIMSAVLDAGRYPAHVYPFWLRALMTFVVPVAVATTVPLQALRGELQWWQAIGFLGIGLIAVWLSSRAWIAGLRRYSGASS